MLDVKYFLILRSPGNAPASSSNEAIHTGKTGLPASNPDNPTPGDLNPSCSEISSVPVENVKSEIQGIRMFSEMCPNNSKSLSNNVTSDGSQVTNNNNGSQLSDKSMKDLANSSKSMKDPTSSSKISNNSTPDPTNSSKSSAKPPPEEGEDADDPFSLVSHVWILNDVETKEVIIILFVLFILLAQKVS